MEATGGVPQVWFLNVGLGLVISRFNLFQGLAMPKGLRRYYGRGHLDFLTFSCYRRLPLLKSARARDVFVEQLGILSTGREGIG